ncbi:uncharacterized protein V6R79_004130 [Siganus canaliculatus]
MCGLSCKRPLHNQMYTAATLLTESAAAKKRVTTHHAWGQDGHPHICQRRWDSGGTMQGQTLAKTVPRSKLNVCVEVSWSYKEVVWLTQSISEHIIKDNIDIIPGNVSVLGFLSLDMCEQPNVVTSPQTLNRSDIPSLRCSRGSDEENIDECKIYI